MVWLCNRSISAPSRHPQIDLCIQHFPQKQPTQWDSTATEAINNKPGIETHMCVGVWPRAVARTIFVGGYPRSSSGLSRRLWRRRSLVGNTISGEVGLISGSFSLFCHSGHVTLTVTGCGLPYSIVTITIRKYKNLKCQRNHMFCKSDRETMRLSR